jgi:hypothetical protein
MAKSSSRKAKKAKKASGQGSSAPRWLQSLSKAEYNKLNDLKKIILDEDTCERVSAIKARSSGVWIVEKRNN